MARQETVLMKTLNYFIKDENNTVLGDSHSSILLPYAPSLSSPEHNSSITFQITPRMALYILSFLEHSLTFFQPSGNAWHPFT